MLEVAHILLINGSNDHQWHKLVAQIVVACGILHIGSESTLEDWIAHVSYAVVLIDASVVAQVPPLIKRIRQQQPCARIVVASAAPTWPHARAAFLAGAFDYTLKSLNRDDLEPAIVAALAAPPPCR